MKPILFNTEMVRAILAGQKTMTRRAIKNLPENVHRIESGNGADWYAHWSASAKGFLAEFCKKLKPPYEPGDILWVRETWTPFCINKERCNNAMLEHHDYCYKATAEHDCIDDLGCKWHPSIHMPRKAARIFLRVTDVRVERLQDIQERGKWSAHDEGFVNDIDLPAGTGKSAARHFAEFWESTIKPKDREKYGWEANPWVWLISFERIEEKT